MPIPALAKSLLYLFGAMSGDERTAFECPPWTRANWRESFGLTLLENNPDFIDEIVDVDDDYATHEFACCEDGLIFSREALVTVEERKLKVLTDGRTNIRAQDFISHFWSQWCLDCKRNNPIEFTIATLPSDNGKNKHADTHGYAEYREVVLAMLNRTGGVLARVQDTMVRLGATPADKWKDDRDVNRRRPARLALEEYAVPIPVATSWTESRDIQAVIARQLFGNEAVSRAGTIIPEYAKTVQCLVQRRYESLARRLRTVSKHSKKHRDAVDICLEVAYKKPTAQALRKVCKELLKWHKFAEESLEIDDDPFLSREKRLKELWTQLGFEVEEQVTRKMSRGVKVVSLSNIPSDAEMELAFQYYVEEYCNGLCLIDDLPIPARGSFHGVHDLTNGEIDIGVQHLKGWSAPQIWESFGLPGATQFPFAEPGSTSKPAAFPYWHQVVAPHAIVERAYTRAIGIRASPAMLCDNVGLGKTIQIIGVISIIRHYYEQQSLEKRRRLAPAPFMQANGTPYFDGMEYLPNLPSIVIAPRTLGSQWMEQWNRFTKHGSFAFVRYSVDQGRLDEFSTNPTGAYRIAAGKNQERASSVVVVADLSAVAKEAKRCLEPPPEGGKGKAAQLLEARGDVAEVKPGIDTAGSLLSMRFRVAAVDECHNLRNSSHSQRGVQMITHNSNLVIGATATPLFTNQMDVAVQARVLQFKPLLGEQGVAYCKAMMESTKEGANQWYDNSAEIIKKTAWNEAEEAAEEAGVTNQDPSFFEFVENAMKKYESEEQVSIIRAAYIAQGSVDVLRRLIRPIMIRRTADSLDNTGKPVLQLPPVQVITAYSPMNECESKVQAEVNDEHLVHRKTSREKTGKQESVLIKWHNFLMDQKNSGFHPLIYRMRRREVEENLKEGSLIKTIYKDWTISNIHTEASTRMLKTDEVVEHFWVGNPKAIVFNEDGTRNLSAQVAEPLPCDKPRKFLIYVEYRTHRELFGIMFKIKNRGFLHYDGTMTAKKRQAAVDKFDNDENCRIMIISNVGSAGLNLTAASVVIIVSSVWSGQERDQIKGRVIRPGQTRDVVVYNIIAPEGIDLALMGISDGKSCVSNRFMMSQKKLQRFYMEVTAPSIDNGEELEQESSSRPVKRTKVASRKRKNHVVDELDDEDEDSKVLGDEEESEPVPRKRAKTSGGGQKTARATPAKKATTSKGQPSGSTSRSKNTITQAATNICATGSGDVLNQQDCPPLPSSSNSAQPKRMKPVPNPKPVPREVVELRSNSDHQGAGLEELLDTVGPIKPPHDQNPAVTRKRAGFSKPLPKNSTAPPPSSTQFQPRLNADAARQLPVPTQNMGVLPTKEAASITLVSTIPTTATSSITGNSEPPSEQSSSTIKLKKRAGFNKAPTKNPAVVTQPFQLAGQLQVPALVALSSSAPPPAPPNEAAPLKTKSQPSAADHTRPTASSSHSTVSLQQPSRPGRLPNQKKTELLPTPSNTGEPPLSLPSGPAAVTSTQPQAALVPRAPSTRKATPSTTDCAPPTASGSHSADGSQHHRRLDEPITRKRDGFCPVPPKKLAAPSAPSPLAPLESTTQPQRQDQLVGRAPTPPSVIQNGGTSAKRPRQSDTAPFPPTASGSGILKSSKARDCSMQVVLLQPTQSETRPLKMQRSNAQLKAARNQGTAAPTSAEPSTADPAPLPIAGNSRSSEISEDGTGVRKQMGLRPPPFQKKVAPPPPARLAAQHEAASLPKRAQPSARGPTPPPVTVTKTAPGNRSDSVRASGPSHDRDGAGTHKRTGSSKPTPGRSTTRLQPVGSMARPPTPEGSMPGAESVSRVKVIRLPNTLTSRSGQQLNKEQ